MENSNLSDDLKYIRTMIERTQKQIDPGAPIMIMWGFVCLIGYLGTHYLAAKSMWQEVNLLWMILGGSGALITLFYYFRLYKKNISQGVSSYVGKQIGMIWIVLVVFGFIWEQLILSSSNLILPSIMYLWAGIYCIALSMMGIVYSKEWLYAGILVFVGMIAAFFMKEFAYIILGISMCLGCVIPAVIAQNRLRKLEKING